MSGSGGASLLGAAAAPRRPHDVDIVVPVYNEEMDVEPSVQRLCQLLKSFPYTARVVVVDNGSTDATWSKALGLARRWERVDAVHLEEKGRGRALRTAWSRSRARVVAYVDVDLSTGLEALQPLVSAVFSGHCEVAIGTRLAPGSRVQRGAFREVLSRGYNALLRLVLRARFSDAQCGFKALRRDVAAQLLPHVANENWFFDTELLVLAQRSGLRIQEIPVDWVEDTDSRVRIARTIVENLRGIARLGLHRERVPVPRLTDGRELAPAELR